MRHHNVRDSDLTTLSADRADFVHLCMKYYSMREHEVFAACEKQHGSFEAAFEKGYPLITAIHREEEELQKVRETLPAPIMLGRKPNSHDNVTYAILSPNLKVRVWGADELAPCGIFSFDFVDKNNQYMLTPNDIKIYSVSNGFTPTGRVYSIEKSVALAKPRNSSSLLGNHGQDQSRADPNWETYVIREGVLLRIEQQGHDDRFLQIPTRNTTNTMLTLQPM